MYADYDRGRGGGDLVPAGWPLCIAQINDCERTQACTDEEHEAWVNELLKDYRIDGRDYYKNQVRRLYRPIPDAYDPIALGC